MKFSLEISSGNAAMAEDGRGEVCRILRTLARHIESGMHEPTGILRDVNGNKVGAWDIDLGDDQ